MDANYANLMSGCDVFLMSKGIVRQSWDKWKLGKKLGDQDDLVQQVAEILLSVKAGKITFDASKSCFEGFVMEKVRGMALTNWMLETPRIKRPEMEQPSQKKDEVNGGDDTDADVGDGKVADARINTVTPARSGADQQADDDDIECDDDDLDDLDDLDDDLDDDAVTPAHRLLSQSDTGAMAKLLDCTSRTVCNMLSRARDRQYLFEKLIKRAL